MPRIVRTLAAFVVCGLLAAACTVNQTIVVKSDGSGTATLHAEVSKLLHDYVASLAEVSGRTDLAAGGKMFDAAAIGKDFAARPGITVKRSVASTPDSLDLDLAFTSIQDVFTRDKTLKSSGVLVYSESGGTRKIQLHLDRSNYEQLSALFPLLKDPTLASLGPQADDTITEDEYLQMVAFSMGDEGPVLLKKSYITLTIDPEGEILSQTGGTVNGGAVVFRIPLVRLMVLDKPLDYSVSYKE